MNDANLIRGDLERVEFIGFVMADGPGGGMPGFRLWVSWGFLHASLVCAATIVVAFDDREPSSVDSADRPSAQDESRDARRQIVWAAAPASESSIIAGTIGPDVAVSNLEGVHNWGSEDGGIGEPIAAFSVGTTSCNVGDAVLTWNQYTSAHPVIRQGMFRLLGGRFEQIGSSWVKHGFLAVNEGACGGCVYPGTFQLLGVNCSDTYDAWLNGHRTYLGPASEINAFSGQFPFPPILQTGTGVIANRLQVRHSDLDPALNSGAIYIVDGHYIHPNDAAFGNWANNASHRRATVQAFAQGCPLPFCVNVAGSSSTQIGRPAIRAWKDNDLSVRETDALVPGEGLFILAMKTSDLGTGFWRYEYALYNMNSHRSARAFRVRIPMGANVQNLGFHDVHHHSGERISTDDWDVSVSDLAIEWSTATFDEDPLANALRWSTLYNFRFDVNVPPEDSAVDVNLFRPGFPETIAIRTDAPRLEFADCNLNEIPDHCDISCEIAGCEKFDCGQFTDCNDSGIPDDPLCKSDCTGDGIPDVCEILFCPPGDLSCGDCNGNGVPDGCEPDCDGDGVIDACEETLDADGDGFPDCEDECPHNTPPGACAPPTIVTCRFANGSCSHNIPRSVCIGNGGTPWCGEPPEERCIFGFPCPSTPCRDGCIVGDWNQDGKIDLIDAAGIQECYSSAKEIPAFVDPSEECLKRLDFDNDGDVDLLDLAEFVESLGRWGVSTKSEM